MISVGIVGYGNLGKAVEDRLKESNIFDLRAIFSKRNLPNCENFENLHNYKGQIDLLFLCGGSQNELEQQAFSLIKDFSIADSYDNHSRLKDYVMKLDSMAKESQKIALCSLGWDPGLFSYMRGLFEGLGYSAHTFWGKGLSQGHTQAIKGINNVVDAIQFTLPNEKIIKEIETGKIIPQAKSFHKRQCFVVADKKHQKEIKRQIIEMKDYFDGYETSVQFVSQEKLNQLKNFSHKGKVLTQNKELEFSIKTQSNPEFTANIPTSFAKAYTKLITGKEFGAYTIFDLPISYLMEDKFKYL